MVGMKKMIDIFIPSYHRPFNLKTVNYFLKIGYNAENIHVFIDDITDDIQDYRDVSETEGFSTSTFSIWRKHGQDLTTCIGRAYHAGVQGRRGICFTIKLKSLV